MIKQVTITAVCNYEGSSCQGLRQNLWFGRAGKQADKWLARLQAEYSKYSDWKIEDYKVNMDDIKI